MRIAGRYLLCSELAAGGMATVHLGKLEGPVGFARTVAIKRLHAHVAKNPDFRSMFLDEARLAARIRHPNVVSTLEVVATERELFLIMEYVEGASLSALVGALRRESVALPPAVVSTIAGSIARGLHAAHEATDDRGEALDIIHRDVSPQNVMVGRDGVVRVVDFGVAKAANREHSTQDNRIKGKLRYMAPEQLRGQAITRSVDVYAAGVVLWELLVGEQLFQGAEGHVVERVLLGAIAPPSSRGAATDAFDAIVAKATSRDPRARYQTADALARAIEGAVRPLLPQELAAWLQDVAAPLFQARAEHARAIDPGEDQESRTEDSTAPTVPDSPEAIAPDPPPVSAGLALASTDATMVGTSSHLLAPPPARRGAPIAAVSLLLGILAVSGWWSQRATTRAAATTRLSRSTAAAANLALPALGPAPFEPVAAAAPSASSAPVSGKPRRIGQPAPRRDCEEVKLVGGKRVYDAACIDLHSRQKQ